ncbi:hypothetical protein VTJ04DRAFT_3167 [Mycothermus thermophilus]|uniref:uncharacterized protein n=1 Tax=Humicola insolens TaxID=85995 RepID=UPI00374244FE
MTPRNSYLEYKRDTSKILYWIIHTSNSIIKAMPEVETGDGDEGALKVNTTGQITVDNLVSLSRLIAKHVGKAPSVILNLFRSVIHARTTTHEAFQKLEAENPDPRIAKSNETHKYFIDALTDAFHALGGKDWEASLSKDSIKANVDDAIEVKDDIDRLLLSNRFGALDLGQTADDSDEENSDREAGNTNPRRCQQPRPGRGKKKRKQGKKSKKRQSGSGAKVSELDGIPLERYRLIQDTDGIQADYLMAIESLISSWIDLRVYLQGLWHECATAGLNTAVAGTVAQAAISMIKREATDIFLDFPD